MLESVLTRIFGLAVAWAVVYMRIQRNTGGEGSVQQQERGPSLAMRLWASPSGQLDPASRTLYHLPHPPIQISVSPRAASLKMQLPSGSKLSGQLVKMQNPEPNSRIAIPKTPGAAVAKSLDFKKFHTALWGL